MGGLQDDGGRQAGSMTASDRIALLQQQREVILSKRLGLEMKVKNLQRRMAEKAAREDGSETR